MAFFFCPSPPCLCQPHCLRCFLASRPMCLPLSERGMPARPRSLALLSPPALAPLLPAPVAMNAACPIFLDRFMRNPLMCSATRIFPALICIKTRTTARAAALPPEAAKQRLHWPLKKEQGKPWTKGETALQFSRAFCSLLPFPRHRRKIRSVAAFYRCDHRAARFCAPISLAGLCVQFLTKQLSTFILYDAAIQSAPGIYPDPSGKKIGENRRGQPGQVCG